jgi:hypothetical protein
MTLATTIGIGGCLGLLVGVRADGADQKIAEFDYLRIQASFGAVASPEIEEDSRDGAGTTTTYEWNGMRESGYQAALTALVGRGILGGEGWQWGAELVFGSYDITPDDFSVGGGINKNSSGSELSHRTFGVNLVGGWQWGMTNLSEFTGFVEVMPHIGAGLAWADNEVNTGGGNYVMETGTGAYWEIGLRVGAYITERQFIYGVNVSYAYGSAEVDMDFPGGYSSELVLERHGFGIGAVAGYRF